MLSQLCLVYGWHPVLLQMTVGTPDIDSPAFDRQDTRAYQRAYSRMSVSLLA